MIQPARTAEPSPAQRRPRGRPGHRLVLTIAAACELTLLALLAWWPDFPFPWPGFLLIAVAVGAYGMAAFAVRAGAGSLAEIWIVGIVARIVLVPAAPNLSGEVWRDLWDGHVQAHGINPYLYDPSAPELESLRTPWFDRIPDQNRPSPNPPLAQLAFLLVAWSGTGMIGLKVLLLLFDLGTAALLVRAARLRERGRRLTLLLYLWSPLLLVETAWNGRAEPLGLLGLAAILAATRQPVWASLGLAWAGLVRIAPWAVLPSLIRRFGPRTVLVVLALVVAVLLPFAGAGVRVLDALGMRSLDRPFNEGAFGVMALVIEDPVTARWVAGLIVLAAGAVASWRGMSIERTLLMVLGAALVLSPHLTPSYALWILPVAALGRRGSWLLLTITAFIGYWGAGTYFETGFWPQPLWSRALLWGPPLLLLFLEAAAFLGQRLGERRESETKAA